MENSELKYYTLDNILKYKAQYNIIFGERSNGKSYAFLKYAIERYCKYGEQFAYIRRFREDFRGKRGQSLFTPLENDGVIEKNTKGLFDHVSYYAGKWTLSKYDEKLDRNVPAPEPCGYAFALSEMEHDKSTSYPLVVNVCFDEFLTRQFYLVDEFVIFMNTLSTIIRHRDNVRIFMLGNTVNKYCPYFREMGLTNVVEMQENTIDLYKYGDSELRVAVERTGNLNKSKPSDIYFAFNNPKLTMITGGVWEMARYPHKPCDFDRADILYKFFIDFNEELLQCEIVQKDNSCFIFIHRKTTPLKNENEDLIFTEHYDMRPNHIRNMLKAPLKICKSIHRFFLLDQVFYQDNEVGEVVRNYLMWCQKETIIK